MDLISYKWYQTKPLANVSSVTVSCRKKYLQCMEKIPQESLLGTHLKIHSNASWNPSVTQQSKQNKTFSILIYICRYLNCSTTASYRFPTLPFRLYALLLISLNIFSLSESPYAISPNVHISQYFTFHFVDYFLHITVPSFEYFIPHSIHSPYHANTS